MQHVVANVGTGMGSEQRKHQMSQLLLSGLLLMHVVADYPGRSSHSPASVPSNAASAWTADTHQFPLMHWGERALKDMQTGARLTSFIFILDSKLLLQAPNHSMSELLSSRQVFCSTTKCSIASCHNHAGRKEPTSNPLPATLKSHCKGQTCVQWGRAGSNA